jgi:homoaconitase/3-isopropylmalate dehydratase large subunit
MMYGVIGVIGRTGPASALFLISPLAAAYAAAAGLVVVAAYRALV